MPGSPSYELRRLSRDLKGIPTDYRKEVRPELRRAATPLLAQVRANASWSSRIPKATKLSISFAARRPGIKILVNEKQAPHASYYENDGKPGFFRHPLFGNRGWWYRQAARPFFYAPLQRGGPEIADDLSNVITLAARRHGFR